MLRKYMTEDLPAITDMIRESYHMSARAIAAIFQGDGKQAWVALVEGTTIGCISMFGSEIHIFVKESYRNRGVGSDLWSMAEDYMASSQADCHYSNYSGDAATFAFFDKRGYGTWFAIDELIYMDGPFPEPKLYATRYENRFFEVYLDTINLCFKEMREVNDIQPHIIFPESSLTDSSLRTSLLSEADRTWIFHDGPGETAGVMGLLKLEGTDDGDGNSIDILAVRPEYQRHGYGKLLTMFGLNRLIEGGANPCFINVVSTNTHVRKLYESVGCRYTMSWIHGRLLKNA